MYKSFAKELGALPFMTLIYRDFVFATLGDAKATLFLWGLGT